MNDIYHKLNQDKYYSMKKIRIYINNRSEFKN